MVSLVVKAPPAPPSLVLGATSLTADRRFRLAYQHSGSRPVILEASSNLTTWTQVHVFTAAGSSEFLESSPATGTMFYRLR